MRARGADWCVGRDRELPPYGNRVITSPGLQGQLMALPPWPGACQPLPWPRGRGKAQVGLEPQAQAGHRVRSPSAGGLGQRDASCCCCSSPQAGTSPQTPKSQASTSALKILRRETWRQAPLGAMGSGISGWSSSWRFLSPAK